MDVITTVIIFSGGLTLGSGLIVYFRNKADQAALYFFLMSMLIALWTFSLAINRSIDPTNLELNIGRLAYIFGFGMVYMFWLFTLRYSFATIRNNGINLLLSIIGCIYALYLTLAIYIWDIFIVETILVDQMFQADTYIGYQYYIFMFMIILYSLIGLKNLIRKTRESTGFISYHSRLITVSLLIAAVVITVCDLILPLFGNFSLNWWGPLSLLPIVISTAHILSLK